MGSASRAFWSSPLLAASAVTHGAGAVVLLAQPSSWPYVLAGLAANHVVISTAGMFPRAGWLGPNVTRLPAPAPGVLALTFDDGPDPEVTPQVLELLARAGHRATFFCVGERVEAHPELAAAIVAAGHGIENHTYSHPNGFALSGPGGMLREVEGAQAVLERIAGRRPSWFRAPAGIQNPFLPFVLARAGLSLVSWTRRGFDTVTPDAARVAARLIGPGLHPGDILLLHDRVAVTLDALPRLLDEMARRGLRSEPLPRPVVARGDVSR
jgi:peptidoglycan-N-acetylglucosamine deacetylase